MDCGPMLPCIISASEQQLQMVDTVAELIIDGSNEGWIGNEAKEGLGWELNPVLAGFRIHGFSRSRSQGKAKENKTHDLFLLLVDLISFSLVLVHENTLGQIVVH